MKTTATAKVTLHRFFQPVSAAEHAAALEARAEAAPDEGSAAPVAASSMAVDDAPVFSKPDAPDAADDRPDAPADNAEPATQRRRRRRRQTAAEAAVPDEQLDLPGALPANIAAPVPCDPEGRRLASSRTFAAVAMVSEFFASFGAALGLGRRRVEFGAQRIDPIDIEENYS